MLQLIRHAHHGLSIFILLRKTEEHQAVETEVSGVYTSRRKGMKALEQLVKNTETTGHVLTEWIGNHQVATYLWDATTGKIVRPY